MSNDLVPKQPSYADWIEALDIEDVASEVTDIAEFAPYVKYVVGAYKWYRTWRAKRFLRALRTAADEMPEAKKKALDRLLKSNEGGEILAQYVDSVLRTSSKTAIVALALLYADADHETYPREFKLAAALALEGISEQEVDAFLDLSQVTDFIPARNQPNPPYPVAVANDKLIDSFPNTAEFLRPPATRVAVVNDLINRGLLLPDFASARYSDGGVGPTYGVSDATRKFAGLLNAARALLPSAG